MSQKAMWMVRAGEGGFRLEEFKSETLVSIGWHEVGDMTRFKTRADSTRAMEQHLPGAKAGQVAASAGQTHRFVREIGVGDRIVSYDSSERIYLVGEVIGGYEYRPEGSAEHPNLRRVRWLGQVARDALSVSARNSLGSISTLFLIAAPVAAEIESLLGDAEGKRRAPPGTAAIEPPVAAERGPCKLSLVGGAVLVNGNPLDRNPLVQAKAQAGWTRAFLKESRFDVHVWPVLLFPGWFVEPFDVPATGAWVLAPDRLSRDEVKAIGSAITSYIRVELGKQA